MRTKSLFRGTCKFCGRARTGETISDDGVDYEGHARGDCWSEIHIANCTCKFGQLVGIMPTIEPMCLNCSHNQHGTCVNPKQISEVKNTVDNYEISVTKLLIKDETRSCNNYELDYTIFDDLMESK